MSTNRSYKRDRVNPPLPPLPTTPYFKPPPPPTEPTETTNGTARNNGYYSYPGTGYEAIPTLSKFMHTPPPTIRPPVPLPLIDPSSYRNYYYPGTTSADIVTVPSHDIYNPRLGRPQYRPTVSPGRGGYRPPFYQNRKPQVSPRPKKPPKKKRRTIAENVPSTRTFDIKLAEMALKVEQEFSLPTRQLVLRFPDPPITRDIIYGLHPAIQKIHFQHPCSPRYCFIQFSEETDTSKVIEELNNTDFGTGKLRVELKEESNGKYYDRRNDKPEHIDPFILFVGNIGHNTPAEAVKQLFHPGRVDIGLSQKMKNSRYAYIRFTNAQDALETFKRTQGAIIGDHSLNVRFRRLNGSVNCVNNCTTVEDTRPEPVKLKTQTTPEPSKEENKATIKNELDLIPVKKEEEVDDYSGYNDEPEMAEEMDIRIKEELMMDYDRYEEEGDCYGITTEMQEEQGSLDIGLSKELSRFAHSERSQFFEDHETLNGRMYPEVPTIDEMRNSDSIRQLVSKPPPPIIKVERDDGFGSQESSDPSTARENEQGGSKRLNDTEPSQNNNTENCNNRPTEVLTINEMENSNSIRELVGKPPPAIVKVEKGDDFKSQEESTLDPNIQVKQEMEVGVSIPIEKLHTSFNHFNSLKSKVNKAITNFLK